ncbi:MAG: hypothetical protein K2K46_10225 [Lachnospiraceae bacterium]|nr:hypothetical protein [Lachnospiraceae bacterium]
MVVNMKITFDNANTNQNVDRVMTTTHRDTRTEQTTHTGGYALDISGTVMDNTAYKGQGKTAEEVMQYAGQFDVAMHSDYMTVMSNSMSGEDYNRMVKDGYSIEDMDMEEVVTIVDTIKAELIKSGMQVDGYTDKIDDETLAEITGSEAFARELCHQFAEHDIPVTEENVNNAKTAYDKAATIDELNEGTVKYMVENHMEPTIDNLYLASHSAAADGDRQGKGYYSDGIYGYYSKKAEEYNWSELQSQMEKVLEEAGLEVNEENLENAKWLIEKGVPLTPEAVEDLHKLDSVEFPQDMKQLLSAIAAAIADGKSAGRADLADGRSNLEKAAEYIERFDEITDEAVDKTAAEEKELTLKNLEAAQKQIDAGQVSEYPEDITARRQLEETRLIMTIEANRKLLESGYYIDTTELERLIEDLKLIEQQRKELMFGETDADSAARKAELYTEVYEKTTQIPFLPIDIAGRFKAADEDFTLNNVHTQGSALKQEYEVAKEKYETLMTAPRADMGDSIRKAFRNVDDILEDMNLETSEENRRAVRILGYNHMELTEENIQTVKEADMELRHAINRMTPAATLQAIRDDKNPLEMTIPELNDYLDQMQYDKEQDAEKYSRFLYKLEKNQEIDAQEREAYIGIYRLFRQIEKADDAAIGTVINNQAEFSFKNMLSALRSSKKHGMDFTIDDSFGGVESIFKNVSISEQIESGFSRFERQLAGEMADNMAQNDSATSEEYQAEQLEEYRQLNDIEDSVVNELLNNNQPVTVNNLLSANMLMNRAGFLFKRIDDFTKPSDRDKVKDAVLHLTESMTDKDSAQEAYSEMQQTYEEVLEEAKYDKDIQFIDLKAIQSCHKQLTLAGNLAKEENYHIPVEINGETTSIHLKVLHGKEDGGKVKATLSTESYGNVAAEFSVRNNQVSGYIACSTSEGVEAIQSQKDSLQENLRNTVESLVQNKMELGSIGVVHSSELDLNSFTAEEAQNGSSVQTADLYQVAKAFITVITA